MSEKNETIVRRFYDKLFITGTMNIATLDDHLADDFVGHDLPAGLEGREGYKKYVGLLATSFSELTPIEVHDIVANGDKVVVRWSSTGRHSDEFMAIPATGRRVTVKGIAIFRLADGKIVDLWQEMDIIGLLQQICAPTAKEAVP